MKNSAASLFELQTTVVRKHTPKRCKVQYNHLARKHVPVAKQTFSKAWQNISSTYQLRLVHATLGAVCIKREMFLFAPHFAQYVYMSYYLKTTIIIDMNAENNEMHGAMEKSTS
jgi:hypothetical protein